MFTYLDNFRGKFHRTDKVHAKVRKFDQQVIGVRIKNPVTNEPPTPKQETAQAMIATVAAKVKTEMADATKMATHRENFKKQRKYKTLTSYVFHVLYLLEKEEQNNG